MVRTGGGPARRHRRFVPAGLVVYDDSASTNVHVAYPGEPYQVEVFSPDDGVALRLVSNGKVAADPAP